MEEIPLQSVILEGMVAGARRGWPKTDPRGLLPALGRPLIAWVLDELAGLDADRVAIAANGHTARLKQGLGRLPASELPRLHFVEETTPRGPAGSARDAYDAQAGGELLVVEGGLYVAGGLAELLEDHRRAGAALTMAVTGRGGRCVPAGLYILSPEAIARIPEAGYVDLKEQLVARLREEGLAVRAHRYTGSLHKIDRPADHLGLVRKIMSDRLAASASPHASGASADAAHLRRAAHIHPAARVHPEADLRGPVYVDAEAVIEKNATVIGPAHIGRGCRVATGAVVCRCVVAEGAVVDGRLPADTNRGAARRPTLWRRGWSRLTGRKRSALSMSS
jgi:mannose-1-phosphate guanylyltransferase/phosphomannomutase